MAEGTRMKQLDEKLARHDEHLTKLLNNSQDVSNTQTGIQGTLELILNHLTVLERAPNKAPLEQQLGTIKNRDLTVLIDSRSTHSFMDANTVKQIGYHINYYPRCE
ncbi:hypothetical protein H5410_041108 [Solanum commersonii]|uniref:Uncharacterized protein n=1 Tax=Solanum commersonii TaxID=4109 RepID=A0A9J5XS31_SOLCO|nr:hypothetical protein H5410_041108 [Solanum commersonii]